MMWNNQGNVQWNQWSLNPNHYANIRHDQVDWAALAQQWIQMKGAAVTTGNDGPGLMEMQNPLQMVTHFQDGNGGAAAVQPKFISPEQDVIGEVPMDLETAGSSDHQLLLLGNNNSPSPHLSTNEPTGPNPWVIASHEQAKTWHNAAATGNNFGVPFKTGMPRMPNWNVVGGMGEHHTSSPTSMKQLEVSSQKRPQTGYVGVGVPPSQHAIPPSVVDYDGLYTGAATPSPSAQWKPGSDPIASRDVNLSSSQFYSVPDYTVPNQLQPNVELDSIRRRTLPAWIREGLEKMEKEKLKKEQKEKIDAEREAMRKRRQEQEKRELEAMGERGQNEFLAKKAMQSKWSGSSPLLGKGPAARSGSISSSDSEEDGAIRTNVSNSNNYSDSLKNLPKEEILNILMQIVKTQLTRIMLEVTNEQIRIAAQETLNYAKRKKEASSTQVKRLEPLASTTGGKTGLVLPGYGSDESESGSDTENDAKGSASHTDQQHFSDFEAELMAEMERKKRNFQISALTSEVEDDVRSDKAKSNSKSMIVDGSTSQEHQKNPAVATHDKSKLSKDKDLSGRANSDSKVASADNCVRSADSKKNSEHTRRDIKSSRGKTSKRSKSRSESPVKKEKSRASKKRSRSRSLSKRDRSRSIEKRRHSRSSSRGKYRKSRKRSEASYASRDSRSSSKSTRRKKSPSGSSTRKNSLSSNSNSARLSKHGKSRSSPARRTESPSCKRAERSKACRDDRSRSGSSNKRRSKRSGSKSSSSRSKLEKDKQRYSSSIRKPKSSRDSSSPKKSRKQKGSEANNGSKKGRRSSRYKPSSSSSSASSDSPVKSSKSISDSSRSASTSSSSSSSSSSTLAKRSHTKSGKGRGRSRSRSPRGSRTSRKH